VAGDDWGTLFSPGNASGALAQVFVADGTRPRVAGLALDTTYFTAGGSKDTNAINRRAGELSAATRTSWIINPGTGLA
jgi:hypothetical protein